MRRILLCDHCPDFFIDELKARHFEITYAYEVDNDGLKDFDDVYDTILIKSALILDEAFFSGFSKIRLVLRPGSGLDNVDVKYCRSHGITVLNSPNGNSNAVGEHALGLLLMMTNHLYRSITQVRNHQWIREPNRGLEIERMYIGVIGVGNTGSAFCEKLKGFNANILPHDKYNARIDSIGQKSVELEYLFENADVVSLHLPLNEETHYYANDQFFNSFSKPIFFINCSRGRVLETQALLRAVKTGKVRQAAIDVIETEPFMAGSPEEIELLDALMQTGKVLITPHIAGWTVEAKKKMFQILLDQEAGLSS